jgi:hypothetical protein
VFPLDVRLFCNMFVCESGAESHIFKGAWPNFADFMIDFNCVFFYLLTKGLNAPILNRKCELCYAKYDLYIHSTQLNSRNVV